MTTYATLTADLQSWTEDDSTEFVAAIPTIIALGERRVFNDSDLDSTFATATATLTANNNLIAPPGNDVVIRYLLLTNAGVKTFLLQKEQSFIADYQPNTSTTGVPRYYAVRSDASLILAPTPDSAYTLEMGYETLPTGLSGSNTTTWLSTYAYDTLLFACLIESAAYLKDDNRVVAGPNGLGMWSAKYQASLQGLMVRQARKRRDKFRNGDR